MCIGGRPCGWVVGGAAQGRWWQKHLPHAVLICLSVNRDAGKEVYMEAFKIGIKKNCAG